MKLYTLLAAAAALTACAPAPQAETETTPSPTGAARAVIVTSLGDITVELAETAAPVSSANFLAHAQAGHYDGGSFYRSVRDDNEREGVEPMNLVQGGHSFDGLPGADGIAHETTEETGLTHQRGAISMARDEPGTATTEFFIMVADYPGLDSGPGKRNPDEAGYAVFGQVVEGMDVVEAIWMSQTSLDSAPEDFQYPQFIVEPVVIETVRVE
jgi:peptidyl-prolyl cis-trans isomerase A (cyclophilin A)